MSGCISIPKAKLFFLFLPSLCSFLSAFFPFSSLTLFKRKGEDEVDFQVSYFKVDFNINTVYCSL